jgi:hypothetical protein
VPPVGTLFAAFLGDNPIRQLMHQIDPAQLQPGSGVDVAKLTGKAFFPHVISAPFMHGLLIAFGASILMLLIAAAASMMRGERYVHAEAQDHPDTIAESLAHEGAALAVPALLEGDELSRTST